MMAATQTAYFVIADISGYTRFLSRVELDHAHDIIGDLMTTLVSAMRPPLRLAKFEGDAAFLYAVAEKIDGAVLQDAIESAYFAFRRRLRDIALATTCECEACKHMTALDVKFVCHHGVVVEHVMAGRKELAGTDVIVVHRLLKNDVSERLGRRAYALYSNACAVAMSLDYAAQGLLAHTEKVDIVGEVTCWVSDLHEAWRAETESKRTCVARDDAALLVECDLPAPRGAIWEYLTVPGLRPRFQHTDGVIEAPASGRRGAGTTNHCMHGKEAVIEEVIDWRPVDYVTLTTLLPIAGAVKILMTFCLTDLPNGATHLELRVARAKPKDAAFLAKVIPNAQKKFTEEFESLRALAEQPSWTQPLVPEPELPPARA